MRGIYKIYLAVALAVLICQSLSAASPDKNLLLDLTELDAKLELRNHFIKQKEGRIESLKQLLRRDGLTQSYIYDVNNQIIDEYRAYQFDSTIYYMLKNVELAGQMQSTDRCHDSYLDLAYIYTTSGVYLEASQIIENHVDTTQLSEPLLFKYYITQRKLTDELSLYSIDQSIVDKATAQRRYYVNRIIEMGDDSIPEYCEVVLSNAIDSHNFDYAYDYATSILSNYTPDEHQYAVITYLMSVISRLKGDEEAMVHWYMESATTDIILAVRDNVSLSLLANHIFTEYNDVERSMRYMRIVMEDSKFFNSKLRPISSSKVLVDIESAYLERGDKIRKLYMLLLALAFAFVVALTFVIIYINRQRSQLILARSRSEGAYQQLATSSERLKRTNEELTQLNEKIRESDRVKEEYIAIFFMMCSEYIDQIEANHRHVRKMLREGKATELKAEYAQIYNSDTELERFYSLFDSTFLNLYPTFVEEFNSLLIEGAQITPRKSDLLTVELRIYALIR